MKRFSFAVFLLAFSATVRAEDDAAEAKKMLGAAKVSINDAIATATKEVPDGKTVKVELDWEDNAPRYEVELLVGDAWKEVLIDGVTGKVQKVDSDVKLVDKDDRRKALAAAKHSFAQAQAAVAKEHKDAKIVKISLGNRDGKATYEVVIFSAEKLTKVYVNAVDGTVTK